MMKDSPASAVLPSAAALGVPSTGARPMPDHQLLARRRRGWELGLPAYLQGPLPAMPPAMIAVGGGKGGVGKSLLSANLAARLAASGLKILAVDLDVGGANLHTYFGVTPSSGTLADAIVLNRKTLREIITPTGVPGLSIIAGGREEAWGGTSALDPQVLRSLLLSLFAFKEQREADLVVLDLGAGTHKHTLDFFLAANLGLVTVLPEPTSIENAYLFMKTALFRLVENVGERAGCQELAEEVRGTLAHGEQAYTDKLRKAAQLYPGFVSQIGAALMGRAVGFAVNQVRCQKDIDVGRSMELIGERYFGFQSRYCGYLNYDDAAWKSLRNRRLLVQDFPHSVLSRRLTELARSVLTNLGY